MRRPNLFLIVILCLEYLSSGEKRAEKKEKDKLSQFIARKQVLQWYHDHNNNKL